MNENILPSTVGFQIGEQGLLPDRPTLVLIHGAGGSSQTFLHQLRRLDRTMNVVALELPGHGSTPGPGRDTISGYAHWVEKAFSSFPIGSFFLGGHSMGGAIALELALQSWSRIKGLILIATGAELPVSAKILEGLARDPEPTLALINKWCFPPDTDPLLIQQSLELLRQTPIQVIYNDFQACNRFDRSGECLDDCVAHFNPGGGSRCDDAAGFFGSAAKRNPEFKIGFGPRRRAPGHAGKAKGSQPGPGDLRHRTLKISLFIRMDIQKICMRRI